MSRVRPFAAWASGLRIESIPPSVRARLCAAVRDAIGCALHGSTLPWTIATRDAFARSSPHSGATVLGTDLRLPAPVAAIVNGSAVHAFELDDFNERAAGVHASASVVPALLALAELRPLSGGDFIAACAVGQEIAVRLGTCLGWPAVERGFHLPGLLGAVAAGAAAARALRQDGDAVVRSIVISARQASGLLAAKRGGMMKRLYAGRAAEIGLTSALLADAGCDAPDDALEGPGGFCESYSGPGGYDLTALERGLGTDLAAAGIQFKLYAACGMVHAALDALRALRDDSPDVGPATVREVEVALSTPSVRAVGGPYEPRDATTAQFSLGYAVAVTLLEGDASTDQFRDELLGDPRVIELARRVRAIGDPSIDASGAAGRNGARVRVRLEGGREIERSEPIARGSAQRPASEAELKRKFELLAAPVLGAGRTRALEDVLGQVAALEDVSVIARAASLRSD